MIDPRTIAEVLKKDRDGSAYKELEKELDKVEKLRIENSNLKKIIKDFESEGSIFKSVVRFACLLTRIGREQNEWRNFYYVLNKEYQESSTFPKVRDLHSDEIIDLAYKISLGSDHWIWKDRINELEKKLKNLLKSYESYMSVNEYLYNENERLERLLIERKKQLDNLKLLGFWSRVKLLFRGGI